MRLLRKWPVAASHRLLRQRLPRNLRAPRARPRRRPHRLGLAARRRPRCRHRRRRPLLPPHTVRCGGGGEILMDTTSSGGNLPMQKTAVLSFAAALLLVAGCQVDPTKFSCSSSAECPTGYHCDLGTTGSAATFKCSNGAAPQKTLTASASKFLLVRAPSPDGTVRTTITAAAGAVTSAPDFIGVRLIASQGGADLADSQVASNGSVLAFQLPTATAQVSLRVQDDSGHSIPVTGYSQEIELGFEGKEVA